MENNYPFSDRVSVYLSERRVSKILLIDDDPQVNEVVKASLELLGHTVVAVEDPAMALETCLAAQPDLTLVDYMLPNCSGLDLLRQIRQAYPRSLGCLATGMADFSLLKQALAAGAGSMLSKPYRLKDLADLVGLAALLDEALRLETVESQESSSPRVSMICHSDGAVDTTVVAALSRFAKTCAAETMVVERTLPLIAIELMKNAATHGSAGVPSPEYQVALDDAGDDLGLSVINHGAPFDWKKVLARAQTGIQKSRASGLQLVMALARELTYRNAGREARAIIAKREGVRS